MRSPPIVLSAASLALVMGIMGCDRRQTPTSSSTLRKLAVMPKFDGEAAVQRMAIQSFGIRAVQQLAKDRPHENFCISPYSVMFVHAIMSLGAKGETEAELTRLLGGAKREDVVRGYQHFAAENESFGNGESLSLKSAVWHRPELEFEPSFLFSAKLMGLRSFHSSQFPDPAVREINRWIERESGGRIKSIANSLSPPANLVLAHVAFFKDRWLARFDPKVTRLRTFHVVQGGTVETPMMSRRDKFLFHHANWGIAAKIPYRSGSTMTVAVPADLDAFIAKGGLQDLFARRSWEHGEGSVTLPKWTTETDVDLEVLMRSVGHAALFRPKADFSGINRGGPGPVLWAKQLSFVKVDEEGTEATAASAIGMVAGPEGLTYKPFELVADRPFLYAIRSRNGLPLIFGVIRKP